MPSAAEVSAGEASFDLHLLLEDGVKYVTLVRAIDGGGNRGVFESDGFFVDSSDPVVLPDSWLSMSRRYFSTWEEVEVLISGYSDAESGIGTIQVCLGPSSIDPSGFVSCVSVPATQGSVHFGELIREGVATISDAGKSALLDQSGEIATSFVACVRIVNQAGRSLFDCTDAS